MYTRKYKTLPDSDLLIVNIKTPAVAAPAAKATMTKTRSGQHVDGMKYPGCALCDSNNL